MNDEKDISSNNVKILVVEDSPTQAAQIEHMVQEGGFSVSIARNGKEGLERAREIRPTIVVSDIVMPEMDGYELCRALKSDPELDGVPVILLTALSDPGDVMKGLECGADNFLVKPCEEEQLVSRIRYLLYNMKIRRTERSTMSLEIVFRGKQYHVTSDRMQILNLLLATYETALDQNRKLAALRDELQKLNEELEEKVKVRTAALRDEIEERRRAQDELSAANRALRAIIAVNHTLVHVNDEAALLDRVCGTIVDIAGYDLAWVGFAEQDEGRTVRPAARAGDDEGFLASISNDPKNVTSPTL